MWHLSKRFKTLNAMERDIEREESRYISLYSSEYLGEAFDLHAAKRETSEEE